MKVSLNLVKKYTRIKVPTPELIELIGSKIGAIESVEYLAEKYDGAVIVRVVELERHLNADKLSVCKIDDGNVTDGIERDDRGLIQVVCGAPNVRKDMLAVWLKPGSIVPASLSDNHPFRLEPKDLRGVISQGMLASSKELDLNNDHDGLLELDKPVVVGQKFSVVYELDDVIIDIENKMLTHRPDCFGILGIAREIAGITGIAFKSPDWYLSDNHKKLDFHKNSLIEVDNTIPELVPEFLVQVIQNIEIKPSDIQTQSYLNRLGIRPINNVVDQTNLVMAITGQPLHAYDYDKLKLLEPTLMIPKIVIRKPKSNETVELLNSKTIKPSKDTILIATNNSPIGLGGVMGGSTTEVDDTTKNIVVECATFDMYSIRRTSMENGILSEAVTRFNKGQSRFQNIHILPYITDSIVANAGGDADSSIVTDNKTKDQKKSFTVEVDFVNQLLGLDFNSSQITKLLTNVEIGVTNNGTKLLIKPPFWRTDLEINEDITEEVGRLFGFDKLKLVLPTRSSKPVTKNLPLDFKQRIRQLLKAAGANETLTYSFVHGNLIDSSDQDKTRAFKLSNALSPDIQYYRLSLAPSLLDKVHLNVKDGFSKFVLFEMSKIVDKSYKDQLEPKLPQELNRLAVVLVDNSANTGSAFYQARAYLDYLFSEFGLEARIIGIDDNHLDKKFDQASKIFEPLRSGLIYVGNNFLGIIGEPKSSIQKHLKLPVHTSILEIDLNKLIEIAGSQAYVRLSRYPKIEQDICFRVPDEVKYSDIFNMVKIDINKNFKDAVIKLTPLDIFKDKSSSSKQITIRLSINSYLKTLKSSDINQLIEGLKTRVSTEFSGEIV
jgi:phenylalanyl-tRNA synthetase beta chain